MPYDPRYYFAFFLHDFGYIGKPNMDGREGETHPELGANVMRWLFGDVWGDFCLFHSRRYAQMKGKEVSQLCVADKLATSMMPAWLFIPLTHLTGELEEYMRPDADPNFESPEYIALVVATRNPYDWFAGLKLYMAGVIEKMKSRALSINALKEQLIIDKYVQLYGEHQRERICDVIKRYYRFDSNYTLDAHVANWCSCSCSSEQ